MLGIVGRLALDGIEHLGSHDRSDGVNRIMSIEPLRYEPRQGSRGRDVTFGELILYHRMYSGVKVRILPYLLLRSLVVLAYREGAFVVVRFEPASRLRPGVRIVFHRTPIMRLRRPRRTLVGHRRSAQHRGPAAKRDSMKKRPLWTPTYKISALRQLHPLVGRGRLRCWCIVLHESVVLPKEFVVDDLGQLAPITFGEPASDSRVSDALS